MSKIKQLNETRGAKLKEAAALSADKPEDRSKIVGLHTEIEGIDEQIMIEARQLELASKTAPKTSEKEERDLNRFDTSKLLRHMDCVMRGQHSVLDGVEGELLVEGQNEARSAQIKGGGIFLPRVLVRRQGFEQRDLTATTGTNLQYGGNTIATEKKGLADDFYNASVLRQNGAMVLEGLTGNLDLPRYVRGGVPTKKTENEAGDEHTPTTELLSLSPNRLCAYIDISDQLLIQSNIVVETFLRGTLSNELTSVQEVAFFHGGGTNEPVGIAGTSGIGSVVGGTNGAAPDWADVVDLETAVSIVNAATGNLRYLTNAKVRGKMKKTVRVASTDSRFLWEGNELNGYPAVVTNAIKSTLTKGSSSVASAIFFGNVNDYVIGYWGGLGLEMVRGKTEAIAGMRTLVASAYYDGGVLRPKSFAAMLDALTA